MTAVARTTSLLGEQAANGQIFSGGWVDAPATIDVVEPATGSVLGRAGIGDPQAVATACAMAARAQRVWAETPADERAAIVERAAGILADHQPELERWIIRESGSTQPKAEIEIRQSIAHLRAAARLATEPLDEALPSAFPGRDSVARRVPLGVVAVITPWNFPVILSMRSVAPALALGNAVVLKSDPETPICGGVLFARAFEEAGLPEGVLHVMAGGAEVGQALAADEHVAMVAFTGSTAAGRAVGETAGRTLKRVLLELGGNSPLVVLADADVEAASSAGAFGSFLHSGQICMATSRHLVHEDVVDDYVRALAERAERLPVGNPDTEQVAIGPVINRRQVDRIRALVDESVAAGATVVVGGESDGLFFPPTVLRDVTPAMPVFAEETFGPVAPVTAFRDDDEAVELANGTGYGLAAAVQGERAHAERVAARLRAGMVHVNDQTVNEEDPAPFGGFGISGNAAHCGGPANLEAFTTWQWRTARDRPAPFPF
ncbi:MAG TPA: aldehyde dehydrogenase family protein [Gaiellaceae bacterium]|nr:aldehyde dehydrogenase family protein [Gaiellaceae bacterium]